MDRELFLLIQEAKNWLASRSAPQLLGPEWQAHNRLSLFIDLLEKDSSLPSLEMAILTLRRYIVANFDWSADYCTPVSRFCAHADQIRRRMKNATTTAPVATAHPPLDSTELMDQPAEASGRHPDGNS